MTKKEVQNRISQNGKKLPLDKFEWDERSKTFSTNEADLVIDFNDINGVTFRTSHNCTFNTGTYCKFTTSSDCIFTTSSHCTFNTSSHCTFDAGAYCKFTTSSDCIFTTSSHCTFTTSYHCTFKTGSNCTFDTGYDCTFDAGAYCKFTTSSDCIFTTSYHCTFNTNYHCTFKTGSNCTFKTKGNSVLLFNKMIIPLNADTSYQTLSYNDNRYLTKRKIEIDYHLDIDGERIPYLFADSILSRIISRKGDVYKVINEGQKHESYVIHSDGVYSHGKTLKEAKDDLVFKVTNRNTSDYESHTLESKLSFEESVKCYRTITGACGSGTKYFVQNKLGERKSEYSISEIIQLTKGEWGNETFTRFFNK